DQNGFPDVVLANGDSASVSVLLNATGRSGRPGGSGGGGDHGFLALLIPRAKKQSVADLIQQPARSTATHLAAAQVTVVFALAQQEPPLVFRMHGGPADADMEKGLETALTSPIT